MTTPSSVDSLRQRAERLRDPESRDGRDLWPERRREWAPLAAAALEAEALEHEFLNSLLARPMSDQDRTQVREALWAEVAENDGKDVADWHDFEGRSDYDLHEDLQVFLEAHVDEAEWMVVELDWANSLPDILEGDDFGAVTAERLGLLVITLADHGPGGGWPVLMFAGPRDAVVTLLEAYDADPSLDYGAHRPACRNCGWSQYGSVFTEACPVCRTGFDWV